MKRLDINDFGPEVQQNPADYFTMHSQMLFTENHVFGEHRFMLDDKQIGMSSSSIIKEHKPPIIGIPQFFPSRYLSSPHDELFLTLGLTKQLSFLKDTLTLAENVPSFHAYRASLGIGFSQPQQLIADELLLQYKTDLEEKYNISL